MITNLVRWKIESENMVKIFKEQGIRWFGHRNRQERSQGAKMETARWEIKMS